MGILEKIIQANKEGRPVTWPDIPHDEMEECIRCGELDYLSRDDYCEHCRVDMNGAEKYIAAAQPVFPFKRQQ